MAKTKYVRLPERLNRTIVADVGGSGWSIAGLDVKPFPTDEDDVPGADQFVEDALRRGLLESATEANYEAVQYANKRVAKAAEFDADAGETINEGAVQQEVRKAFRDLLKDVGEPAPEPEDEEEEVESEDEEEDEFEAMTRDELVEYGNEVHKLGLAKNISTEDALAAVRAAEASS